MKNISRGNQKKAAKPQLAHDSSKKSNLAVKEKEPSKEDPIQQNKWTKSLEQPIIYEKSSYANSGMNKYDHSKSATKF